MNINLDQALTEKIKVHENVSQEIILISADKVKLILIEHHKVYRKKVDWVAPVGIFITVLATVLTAKFEEAKFGVPAQMWQGVFILAGIGSFVWSFFVIINVIRCRNKGTVDDFIVKLRSNSN